MANASAKRIAQQNEAAVKTLNLGAFLPTLISLLFRFLFSRSPFKPTFGSVIIYAITFIPTVFLGRYLIKIGSPRRDSDGSLISSGEDLNQPGVTEWCFDVLYVTWVCQVGSGLFGEKFWWLYMVIPLYAGFKLWTSFVGPMLLGRSSSAGTGEAEAAADAPTSKRQAKLQKRADRGDPRIQKREVRRPG